MKLSFIPADLHLLEEEGAFLTTLQGSEVFRSPNRKKALAKFNSIKGDLVEKFPSHKPSSEEISELLQKSIADSLVGHNSWRPEERNRKKVNSTRTFG